jgi:hypothetical protein
MKAARKTESPVSEELSARARAYWTPERRAEQGFTAKLMRLEPRRTTPS